MDAACWLVVTGANRAWLVVLAAVVALAASTTLRGREFGEIKRPHRRRRRDRRVARDDDPGRHPAAARPRRPLLPVRRLATLVVDGGLVILYGLGSGLLAAPFAAIVAHVRESQRVRRLGIEIFPNSAT